MDYITQYVHDIIITYIMKDRYRLKDRKEFSLGSLIKILASADARVDH